jgi:hypothetical protein
LSLQRQGVFELEVVAPYLVALVADDRKTGRFISQAWGNSLGIFLKCDARLETLRRHIQALLLVRDDGSRRLSFRYYDPRVLRVYLPTCRIDEVRTVFAPIERCVMEDRTPDVLLDFSFDKRQLVMTRSSPRQPER